MQVRAAEIPSVHEEELVAKGLLSRVGTADKAPDAHQGSIRTDINDIPGDIASEEVQYPELKGLGGLEHEDVPAVVREGEGNVRTGDGYPGELLYNMLELDVVGLEELAACGNVVEDVAHGEGRAAGSSYLLLRDELGGGEDDLGADLVFGAAGAQGDFGHSRYRGKRLAAEAEGHYVLKVLGRGDLGSRVTLETEHGVVSGHAAAVVDDLEERTPRVGGDHRHAARAGVQGILHEFLHHGRGPLYDLARGDHVGYVAGQYPELRHYRRE